MGGSSASPRSGDDLLALREVAAHHLDADGEHYALVDADHSRLGDLSPTLVDNGGSVALTAGDTLALVYRATEQATPGAASWYLLVRPAEGAAGPSQSAHSRPGHDGPARFALHASEPNPTGTRALIRFELPVECPVRLEVFDLLGRRVATPLRGAPRAAGPHSITLETRGWRPGLYYGRVSAAGDVATTKFVVIR